MKKFLCILLLILTAFFFTYRVAASGSADFQNLYRSGEMTWQETLRISIDSLPEAVSLKSPISIVFNSAGDMFVSDISDHNLKQFKADGTFVRTIGRQGTGPGDLNSPSRMVFNGKYIIVWEIRNRRFSLFDESGKFVRHERPKQMRMLRRMEALKDGRVVIENEVRYRGQHPRQECIIGVFDPEMKESRIIYVQPIVTQQWITKPRRDNIPAPFPARVSWGVLPDDRLVIGFQGEYRLDFFNSSGEKLASTSHSRKPVPVTENDKKKYFAGMTVSVGDQVSKGAPNIIVENTTFPKYKPAFQKFVVDPQGYIWVFPSTSSNSSGLSYFDLFDPSGRFMKQVSVSGLKLGYYPPMFGPDGSLWAVVTDENDESIIIQYHTGTK